MAGLLLILTPLKVEWALISTLQTRGGGVCSLHSRTLNAHPHQARLYPPPSLQMRDGRVFSTHALALAPYMRQQGLLTSPALTENNSIRLPESPGPSITPTCLTLPTEQGTCYSILMGHHEALVSLFVNFTSLLLKYLFKVVQKPDG